jgi:C4-dicarboxylate transporter DctQ subunit
LLLYRFVQAGIRIAQGRADTIIASHEAEEAVEDAASKLKDA